MQLRHTSVVMMVTMVAKGRRHCQNSNTAFPFLGVAPYFWTRGAKGGHPSPFGMHMPSQSL